MLALLINKFIEEIKMQPGCSGLTLQAYAGDLRLFAAHLARQNKRAANLADFNLDNVENYFKMECRAGIKESTLYRRRASLRKFAKFLIEKQILEKDPTMDFAIECRSLGAVQKKGNGEIILAQEEIGRLREKLKGINHPRSYRDLAIIELILETGILINALVGLNVADLDLRPEMGVLSSRAVGMSPLIIELAAPSFRQYLRLGRPEFAHNENEQALFISQLGGRMTRQGIWQLLGKWGAAAKLRTKLSPRILRNTAVYNMLTSGRSIVEIQQILGHRNPFSTSAYLRRVEKIASIEINK